jgi:hypothetical protein
MSSGALSGYRCRWVSRPARLARALDVERVAWPRGEAQPCPGCGLRGRTVLAREPPCDPVNDPTRTRRGDRSSKLQHERGGTEVRASVGPYIMSVMKNMYQKSLATIIGQARARAAECMLIRLGQVRDPRRTSDHQMSGCLPYAGWLATPPSLQHLAVAW